MNPRVSIIQHFTGDLGALGAHLPELMRELQARGAGDEVLLVDDTGTGELESWALEHFPAVRVVVKNRREGRSKAHLMGAQAASGEFLFLLGPEVRMQRGCLGPLIAALQGPNVYAATPRILQGPGGEPEMPGPLAIEQGRPVVLPSSVGADETHLRPVPFAGGSALFVRRDAFLAHAGFDALFPSPYWEDVDLGLTVWRQGMRILEVSQAVVERHPVESMEVLTVPAVDRAAIERGRLLLQWKHLDSRAGAAEHVQGLWRDAVDAALGDWREELVWLAMALDDLGAVTDSRAAVHPVQRTVADALRLSDPTRL